MHTQIQQNDHHQSWSHRFKPRLNTDLCNNLRNVCAQQCIAKVQALVDLWCCFSSSSRLFFLWLEQSHWSFQGWKKSCSFPHLPLTLLGWFHLCRIRGEQRKLCQHFVLAEQDDHIFVSVFCQYWTRNCIFLHLLIFLWKFRLCATERRRRSMRSIVNRNVRVTIVDIWTRVQYLLAMQCSDSQAWR